MSNAELKFASDFVPATDEAWRKLVDKALGGKPFEKVMQSQTYDGIQIEALYTKATAAVGPRPNVREGDWGLTVPHWNPDARATNKAMLEDLEGGATGIALRLQAGAFPGVSLLDIDEVLEGVHLDMASLTLVPGEEYEAGAEAVLALLDNRNYIAKDVTGTLGIDPISTLAQTGRLKEPVEHAVASGAQIAAAVSGKYSNLTSFMADGGLYHMSGATEAQELGLLLATGVAYLRAMENAGVGLDVAARQISFSLSADADILLTIAKFRAARLLWQQVLEVSGVTGAPMKLSGVSSLRMVSVKDPWVNILRCTAACFGAGVGGADNVCLLPYDTMLGVSSDFARRMARNVQIILQEESGLSKVTDPAAGAYSFESITSELLDNAWKYFINVEGQGGIISSLKTGGLQKDLRTSWAERQANIAKRKDPITGVSEFPLLAEKAITNVGAIPPMVADIAGSGDTIEPIEFHRLSEDFETLRAYSDACLEKNGTRPRVFLVNIGSAADYTARSTFAKNFFESGGIEAIASEGALKPARYAEAFAASGSALAVLCSCDALYEEMAVEVASALKNAGAARVYLAGRPAESDSYLSASIDEFVYAGCDVLQSLAYAHSVVGASR